MTADAILWTQQLTKRYGGVVAVDRVDLSIPAGAITGLIGPNGSGKTTLLNLVSGVVRPDSGRVYFENDRIDGVRPHRLARSGIGRTFQRARVFPQLSVLENLLCVRPNGGDGSFHSKVARIAGELGLELLLSDPAGTLSFGQQRRLEFARTLLGEPRLLLLDELFSGVDPVTNANLVRRLRDLRRQQTTTLLIDHDMNLVMDVCDHVVVMDRGTLVAEGPPARVQRDERVLAAYLGTAEVRA